MEDMYCDNDYINMTPTRCSVLIRSESGDEQIIMMETYGPYEGSAEQHYYIPVRGHEPRAYLVVRIWLVSSVLESVGRSCMDCAYNNHVS